MSQSKEDETTYNKEIRVDDPGIEASNDIDENSEVMQQFRGYAAELDDRQDRSERILKIGRDITIKSKRIISLLHSIDKESKHDTVLQEAKSRLENVAENQFKRIALELENEDAYQYLKVYCSGLEEYVEAFTFYHYLLNNDLKDWTELEKMITFTVPKESEERTITTLVTPYIYVLGIADLTGELMRRCINNLTQDTTNCNRMCTFVRNMYKGFLSCTSISNKTMNRKLSTLKQSLCKIENVCYTIKARGSEIPKHILLDVATDNYEESNERYHEY